MMDEVERQPPGDSDRAAETQGTDGGWAAEVPLHPIAIALRRTFDADNHATLGRDVTGLMLDLSRVPFEPHEFEPVLPPLPPPTPPPTWLERARLAVRRLRQGGTAEGGSGQGDRTHHG